MQYQVTIKFALHQSSHSICATNRSDVHSEPKEPEVKHTKRLHACNVGTQTYTVYGIRYYIITDLAEMTRLPEKRELRKPILTVLAYSNCHRRKSAHGYLYTYIIFIYTLEQQ